MSRRSAMADWIGSDSPNKPQHRTPDVLWGGFNFLPRNWHSGDYLMRNVKRAKENFTRPLFVGLPTVGPEHDH